MISSLLGNEEDYTAVRQPVIEFGFGAGGNGGGLAEAVGLVQGGDDPWTRSLLRLSVTAGLAPFVDVVSVDMAANAEAPQVAPGEVGTISLGYGDSAAELVFTAIVHDVSHNIAGTRQLKGTNGGESLSRLRINQSYEQQSASDLVGDLVGQAEVDIDVVEPGIDLPFYVIDDRYNAYEHIHRLARKSGYIAHFTPEGKLYFGPEQSGQAVQTFSYANDILEIQVQKFNAAATAATVIGEGAAGAEGQEAWSWLIKNPGAVTAEAGNGNVRLIQDASLRSSEACQIAADGIAARTVSRSMTGRILTPGVPAVAVGSVIGITDAPVEDMNGEFFVCRVSHCYSKQRGFTTLVHFRQTSGSGGALGGLL